MKNETLETVALQQDRLSALEKSMLVIEAIVDHPQPISLPELTLRLGIPRQTIHRVLQQLTGLALITRVPGSDRYILQGKARWDAPPRFATYGDHRMAMAFATLAMLGPVEIENPAVVAKSYPAFWEHLAQVGFSIEKFTAP